MAQSKTLSIKLSLNDKQFQSSLKKTTRSLKKFGSSLKTTGKNLTTSITLPVLALGVASAKLASDFEEALNKVNVAFGESSDVIQNFAKTTLNSFGIAEGSALEMASLFGDMATSMGISQQEAANMSTALVGLAGDLASFKNIGIEQAQTALAGIFTGETESLKRLGIVMTEANLKSFALSQGMDANVKSMTQAQKVALRYQFILKSTANAQGDFARTSEGVANTTRSVSESLKELGTEMGQMLLPITEKVLNILKSVISRFNNLSDETKETIIQMGLLFAAIGPIIMVLGSLVTSLGVIIPIAVKVVAAINPITLAITAAVTAIGFFIKRISDLKKEHDEYNKVVGDFEPMQEGFVPTSVTPTTPKTPAIQRSTIPERIEPIKALGVELDKIPEKLDTIDEKFNSSFIDVETYFDRLSRISQMISRVLMAGADNFKSFAEQVKSSIRSAIGALIAEGVAAAISTALKNPAIAINPALIPVIAGLAGGLAKTAFNSLIPAFADGGMVTGATLAMVGEGPGTSMANPEVIAPLDKLRSLIGVNGGGAVEVFGTISGADILLSSDRARNNRNRTRGY
tara:strand:- start:642 stop:2366 length:1725 start_codon:yes stop_codon:yes gene_type:complete